MHRVNRKATVSLETIPASTAELTLPIASLHSLPKGAVFTEKSGAATVGVKVEGDTVYVTAHCDSLQQVIYHLVEEVETLKNENEELKTEKKPRSGFGYGLLTGALLITILLLLIKRK